MYNYFGNPTMRIFPYVCDWGNISLYDDELDENKTVKACKSVTVYNYDVLSGADLEIYFGQSFEITDDFEAEIGSTLSIEAVNIKTGFIE